MLKKAILWLANNEELMGSDIFEDQKLKTVKLVADLLDKEPVDIALRVSYELKAREAAKATATTETEKGNKADGK